eukprot:1181609-Prorocentrum_minimum.AAC.3
MSYNTAPQPYAAPGGYNPYVTGGPPPPQPVQMQQLPTSYPAPPGGYAPQRAPMQAPPPMAAPSPMVAPPSMLAPQRIEQSHGCWCNDKAPEWDECPKVTTKVICTPPSLVAYVAGLVICTGLGSNQRRCLSASGWALGDSVWGVWDEYNEAIHSPPKH